MYDLDILIFVYYNVLILLYQKYLKFLLHFLGHGFRYLSNENQAKYTYLVYCFDYEDSNLKDL